MNLYVGPGASPVLSNTGLLNTVYRNTKFSPIIEPSPAIKLYLNPATSALPVKGTISAPDSARCKEISVRFSGLVGIGVRKSTNTVFVTCTENPTGNIKVNPGVANPSKVNKVAPLVTFDGVDGKEAMLVLKDNNFAVVEIGYSSL